MTDAPQLLVIEERAEYTCGKTAGTREAGAATQRVGAPTRRRARTRRSAQWFETGTGARRSTLRAPVGAGEHPAAAVRARCTGAVAGSPARRDPRPPAPRGPRP